MRRSLKNALTLNLVIVSVLPLLAVGLVMLHLLGNSLEDEITQRNLLIARTLAGEVDRFLEEPLSLLRHVGDMIHDEGLLSGGISREYLEMILRRYRTFERILVVDPRGKIKQAAPFREELVGLDVSGQPFFRPVLETGEPAWSAPFISAETGAPTITLAVPYPGGMLAGDLNLSVLQDIAKRGRIGREGYAAMVDRTGVTIAHPNPAFVSERLNVRNLEIIRRGLAGAEGTWRYHFRGQDKIGSVALVSRTGWLVVVIQPVDEAFAPVSRVRTILTVGIAAALGLALALAFLTLRRTIEPLTQLVTGARKVAKGDYRLDPLPPSWSEVDELAADLQIMADAIAAREESLRESEAKYRCLFEVEADALLPFDAESGEILDANPAVMALYGYGRNELLGMRYVDLSADPEETRKAYASAIPGGVSHIPLRYHRKQDGTVFPVEIVMVPFVLNGRSALLPIIRDITERRRGEKQRLLLATAIEQAEENVLITDDRRTILYINPAFERSSGYGSEELKGKKLRVLRSDQHDEAFYRHMKETLNLGKTWMGTIINKGKDGREFEIDGTISPVRDACGSITHFVAAGRNMKHFRKLEKELHQAQKMESVGRLAGGVAHDFNNMLSVIIGHSELALNVVDSNQRAYVHLQDVLKAAHRSADLVRQLLAFARKQTIRPKVLDLNETVESMLKMLRRLIGEDIDLVWMPSRELWPIKADPSQVDQILANLCVNARDAITGVGKVTIETGNAVFDEAYCREHDGFVPGQYVLFSMSDDGCGMDQEVLNNVFEPFFTTKEVGKGTGLGLATVYGIMKQNAGFINVYSEPGHGTTFKLYFPRTDLPVSTERHPERGEKDLSGTETILLVEDEESILGLAKTILEQQGYQVLATRSPADALSLVTGQPGPIHLLITDVVMPGMNGKDLCEKLCSLKPGLKCIFMSGYTANVVAHHGILDEGVHFLQKPFSSKALAQKVREVLEDQ